MGVLSRRQFLAVVGGLAAAGALPRDQLAHALATAPPRAAVAEAPSSLTRTILQGGVQKGFYRALVAGPGEPHLPRLDVLRRAAAA